MNGNDFVRFILQTPLHVFMGNTMLITVTGRKTGRKIATPVNYYFDGDVYWIISTRTRKWWRNLRGGAEVGLHLHGRELKGFAETVLDEKTVAARAGDYLMHFPMAAGALKVRIDNGVPNPEDTARLASERLFVKICPVD